MKKKALEVATETDVAMMELMSKEMTPMARDLRERVIWRNFKRVLRDSSELRRYAGGFRRFDEIFAKAQEWAILPLDVLAYCEEAEAAEIARLTEAGVAPLY